MKKIFLIHFEGDPQPKTILKTFFHQTYSILRDGDQHYFKEQTISYLLVCGTLIWLDMEDGEEGERKKDENNAILQI